VSLPEKGTFAVGRNKNRLAKTVKREEEKLTHIPEAHL
jgi:hypothetical protein